MTNKPEHPNLAPASYTTAVLFEAFRLLATKLDAAAEKAEREYRGAETGSAWEAAYAAESDMYRNIALMIREVIDGKK